MYTVQLTDARDDGLCYQFISNTSAGLNKRRPDIDGDSRHVVALGRDGEGSKGIGE